MSGILLSSVLVLSAPPSLPAFPLTSSELEVAVERLGSPKFAVRDEAMRLLWHAGEAAEEVLTRATRSRDPEVALRARTVLDKFRLGLYPSTPPEVAALIVSFRDGDANARNSALQQLAQRGHARTVLRLVEAETDPQQRQHWKRIALHQLLERGHISEVVRLFEAETDPSLRADIAARVAATPERVLGPLVLSGQFDMAERLLETAATHDEGMRRYAMFLLLRDRIPAKLAALDDPARAADPLPRDELRTAALRAYLLRAQGDLEAALRSARKARENFPDLERGLLSETRRFAELAEWYVDRGTNDPDGAIEWNGFAAAYFQRAADERQLKATLERVRKTANEHPEQTWFAAEVFLVLERYDEAFALLKDKQPQTAFRLFCERGDYRPAFELAGLNYPEGPSADWRETLLRDIADKTPERRGRFALALEVARALRLQGRRTEAAELLRQLANVVAGDEDGRLQRLRQVIDLASRVGDRELAFELGARAMAAEPNVVLATLFSERSTLAVMWWRILRTKFPQEAPGDSLARLRGLLERGPLSPSAAEFAARIDDGRQLAEADAKLLGPWLVGLAETCLLHDERVRARGLLERAAPIHAPAALKLADLSFADQQWLEAATWYESAAKADGTLLAAVYFRGAALEAHGRAVSDETQLAEGRRLQAAASLAAVSPTARHALAAALKERGRAEQALEQWRLLVRLGPFQDWNVNDAAKNIGNAVSSHDRAAAAAGWERLLLSTLQRSSSFIEPTGYLQLPRLIHKYRGLAALEAGREEEARAEFRAAQAVHPSDVDLVEDVYPELTKAGKKVWADELFDATFVRLETLSREFPRSPLHLNNLAWLCARCDRHLEQAHGWATRATELEPTSAAYLDTLAETCFRLGRIAEAIAHEEKCLQLDPRGDHYPKQLQRFRDATK